MKDEIIKKLSYTFANLFCIGDIIGSLVEKLIDIYLF